MNAEDEMKLSAYFYESNFNEETESMQIKHCGLLFFFHYLICFCAIMIAIFLLEEETGLQGEKSNTYHESSSSQSTSYWDFQPVVSICQLSIVYYSNFCPLQILCVTK